MEHQHHFLSFLYLFTVPLDFPSPLRPFVRTKLKLWPPKVTGISFTSNPKESILYLILVQLLNLLPLSTQHCLPEELVELH